MSQDGRTLDRDAPWRIATNAFAVTDRVAWERHAHEGVHELLWGSRGALTAETDDGYFAVPAALGLWIPAGTGHRVVAAAGTAFRCTFIESSIVSLGATVTAVGMSPVLRELIEMLSLHPSLGAAARLHAEALVVELLQPVEIASVDLPLPEDARIRRVADALLRNPSDARGIEAWGREVGASGRNLSRLFVAETGMNFADWRTRARMRRAVEWLAADYSVVSVSRRVGYATPSAFVQAFRREIGRTPGEFASARQQAAKSA